MLLSRGISGVVVHDGERLFEIEQSNFKEGLTSCKADLVYLKYSYDMPPNFYSLHNTGLISTATCVSFIPASFVHSPLGISKYGNAQYQLDSSDLAFAKMTSISRSSPLSFTPKITSTESTV